MLASVGTDYHALQCGSHRPLFAELGIAPLPEGFVPDERHNNCSGKHAGFVAHCVLHGLPLEGHLDPSHPLQVAIREHVARVVGLTPLMGGTQRVAERAGRRPAKTPMKRPESRAARAGSLG